MPLALILAALLQTPAPAPTTEAGDARCLVAFAAIGSTGTPDQQEAARVGAMFFYGKLVGRRPALDLGAAMRTGAAEVQPQIKAEIARCGAELQAAGRAMQAAGGALKAR